MYYKRCKCHCHKNDSNGSSLLFIEETVRNHMSSLKGKVCWESMCTSLYRLLLEVGLANVCIISCRWQRERQLGQSVMWCEVIVLVHKSCTSSIGITVFQSSQLVQELSKLNSMDMTIHSHLHLAGEAWLSASWMAWHLSEDGFTVSSKRFTTSGKSRFRFWRLGFLCRDYVSFCSPSILSNIFYWMDS